MPEQLGWDVVDEAAARLRAFKVAAQRPYGLSGVAFAWGYLRAAWGKVGQVEDEELRAFVRAELQRRLRRPLALLP